MAQKSQDTESHPKAAQDWSRFEQASSRYLQATSQAQLEATNHLNEASTKYCAALHEGRSRLEQRLSDAARSFQASAAGAAAEKDAGKLTQDHYWTYMRNVSQIWQEEDPNSQLAKAQEEWQQAYQHACEVHHKGHDEALAAYLRELHEATSQIDVGTASPHLLWAAGQHLLAAAHCAACLRC